jgi:hypothetical protein
MLPVASTEGRAVDTKKRLDLAVSWAVFSPAVIDSRLGGGGVGRDEGIIAILTRSTKGGNEQNLNTIILKCVYFA